MKSILRPALIVLFGSVSSAFAAGGSEPEGLSWLAILFLFFGALIIVFQMIPGVTLFVSMIRGLFVDPSKKVAPAVSGEKGKN